jgi:hypothetical protein
LGATEEELMRSLRHTVVVVLLLAITAPSVASAGIVFGFRPTNPKPGTRFVFLTVVPTEPGYTGAQLPGSYSRYDLYLVRNADAPSVHSAADARLIPLGRYDMLDTLCCPAHFRVKMPQHLDGGAYAIAARCLNCTGKTFFVVGVGSAEGRDAGLAPLMLLHVQGSAHGFPFWRVGLALLFVVLCAVAVVFVRRRQRRQRIRAVAVVSG